MRAMGRKHWAIAEAFIPGESNGPAPLMTSHETVCMLNTGESDAHVEITIYFQDRDPVGSLWCQHNGPSTCSSTTSIIPLEYRATLRMRARSSPMFRSSASILVSIRGRPRMHLCQPSPMQRSNDR